MKLDLLWGWPNANTPIDIHDVDVAIPPLAAALEGVRLAVLSDLHFGRFIFGQYTRHVVGLVNASRPEAILLAGDMVNQLPGDIVPCAEALAGLKAPHGVLACPGNHDYYAGWRRVRRALLAAGVDVLVNHHRILNIRGAELAIAGADEFRQGEPDVAAALAGLDGRMPVILLSHNPDMAEALPAGCHVDLMLSGHTHGGQLTALGRPLVTRTRHRKYWRGLVQGPRCLVYTSRGIGMVGLPLRLGSRPEIPIIRLRRAE